METGEAAMNEEKSIDEKRALTGPTELGAGSWIKKPFD